MATQKHTVQSHLTVLNVVDRMIHNPVGNPEIPLLNVSFAAEAILLIIMAATVYRDLINSRNKDNPKTIKNTPLQATNYVRQHMSYSQ
jgi:hypothetical protein